MSSPIEYALQDQKPLYPQALYNRPITRHAGGRLLIPGGHTGDFSLITAMHQIATSAGLGECQVLLPDVLAKLLSGAPDTYFAPSNPSGSLGLDALGRIDELAQSADAIALGANLSGNSTTSMLIERLAQDRPRPLVFFGDALTAVKHHISTITDNPDALVIATMPEIFKLCGALSVPINIRPDAGLINKLEIIQDLRAASACQYVVFGSEIVTAADTAMIVTPINWRVSASSALFYAVCATLWIQNRSDEKAGLATAAYILAQVGQHFDYTHQPTPSQLASTIRSFLNQDNF